MRRLFSKRAKNRQRIILSQNATLPKIKNGQGKF
jgi:hypothetical protein